MTKCNVIFPGAFKPVHSGHILLMEKYLNSKDYDVNLTILISKQDREGIHAESSKWFLDQAFAGRRNVKILISPDPSPITTTYNMTGEKEYGDGIYAMGTSTKGDDMKRAEQYVKKFSEGEKYYTPGISTIMFSIDPTPIMYQMRKDLYAESPISSTIVRQDVRNDDFTNFRTAYLPLIHSDKYPRINDEVVKTYFEMLKKEVLPIKTKHINSSIVEEYISDSDIENMLNEGGAAGHMQHPYEVNEFTFYDLISLIRDLFAGNIENVTEKLDGQNLFASVDDYGNTIFARNKEHLFIEPWKLEDIQNNPKWSGTPAVQHAFTNASLTIDKVFKNIKNAAALFNYDDKADGVRYRTWVNLEILDTENFNVIPYVESKISFHGLKTTVFDYSDKESFTKDDSELRNKRCEIIDLPEVEYQKVWSELEKAIVKTNRTAFKVQITPEVIIKKQQQGEEKASKYIQVISDIINNAGISYKDTILDYKQVMLNNYIGNSGRLKWLTGPLKEQIILRWVGLTKESITNLKKNYSLENNELMNKEQYNRLRDFEKNDLKAVIKKIMSPLDKLFILVGNEIIKRVEGLANAGHEKEVVSKISKEIRDMKKSIENSNDPIKMQRLEASLQRLAVVNNEYNATEGIVFNYKGHTLKLTGVFAPINQLLGEKFRKN